MNILKINKETRGIINDSIRRYKQRLDDYCYVYLHSSNGVVFYIGMGSADRAARIKGRSILWYKTVIGKTIDVEIVASALLRTQAEKIEIEYIKKHTDTCINYQHKDSREKPVLQIDRNGVIVKEYVAITATRDEGFHANCVLSCCKKERGLHKNFFWMYKSDFEENGLNNKAAKNHARLTVQYDKSGNKIRQHFTAQSFAQYGFSPGNIQQVCSGLKKSHKGFIFKYE